MGELMYASHASYSACGLGSDGTDLLVELVRQAGPAAGLFGAKITGGGSGGTVAILGRADAAQAVAEIARRYHEQTGREPYVFAGSSTGCVPISGCDDVSVEGSAPTYCELTDMEPVVEDQLNHSMFRAYDIRTPSSLLTPELAERLARAEAVTSATCWGCRESWWPTTPGGPGPRT